MTQLAVLLLSDVRHGEVQIEAYLILAIVIDLYERFYIHSILLLYKHLQNVINDTRVVKIHDLKKIYKNYCFLLFKSDFFENNILSKRITI